MTLKNEKKSSEKLINVMRKNNKKKCAGDRDTVSFLFLYSLSPKISYNPTLYSSNKGSKAKKIK